MYDLNAELLYPFLFRLKIIERNAKGKMRKGSQLRVDLRRFISRVPIDQFLFEKRQVFIPCPDGIEYSFSLAMFMFVFSQNFKTYHLFVESSHQVKVVDTQRYFSNSFNRLVRLIHNFSFEGGWIQRRSLSTSILLLILIIHQATRSGRVSKIPRSWRGRGDVRSSEGLGCLNEVQRRNPMACLYRSADRCTTLLASASISKPKK